VIFPQLLVSGNGPVPTSSLLQGNHFRV